MTDYIQVITTVDSEKAAKKISKTLVDKRLVACAQIVHPVTSTYRWKQAVESAQEWMIVMKSRDVLFGEIEKALTQIHPYDTPELVATQITSIGKKYRAWMDSELL